MRRLRLLSDNLQQYLTFHHAKSFHLHCRMPSSRSRLHPMPPRQKMPESSTVRLFHACFVVSSWAVRPFFAYPIGYLGADDRQSDENIGRVMHQPSGLFYMLLGRVFDQFAVCSLDKLVIFCSALKHSCVAAVSPPVHKMLTQPGGCSNPV